MCMISISKYIPQEALGGNSLDVTGTVNNNTASPDIDLTAQMRDFDLSFTQQFVQSIFGNLRGKATGDLKINGKN